MRKLLLGALWLSVATSGYSQQVSQGNSLGYPLFDQPVASSGVTFATNTETQITSCSFSVPAGTFVNAKDKIRWWAAGSYTASTDTKTVVARWGATLGTGNSGNNVGATTNAIASGNFWVMHGYITKLNSTTQRVSATGSAQNSGNTAPAASTTSTLADTNPDLFVITGKSSNATPPNDTVVCGELHMTFEVGAP